MRNQPPVCLFFPRIRYYLSETTNRETGENMIGNLLEIVIGFAANILALLAALGNPAFSEVGIGLSIVSFIIRTLGLF